MFTINELALDDHDAAWDGEKAAAPCRHVDAAGGFKGNNSTAEIPVHPNGRFLYGSNRGHDSIAVFTIAATELTLVEHELTRGKTPRHFTLDPPAAG